MNRNQRGRHAGALDRKAVQTHGCAGRQNERREERPSLSGWPGRSARRRE